MKNKKDLKHAQFILSTVLLAVNVAGFSVAIANYVLSLIAFLREKKEQK